LIWNRKANFKEVKVIKKAVVLAAVVGGLSLLSGGVDQAEAACNFTSGTGTGNFVLNCETNIMGSPVFSFDPSQALQGAVERTSASAGSPCFTCPNGDRANGTTAGALTNNMFGKIRDNSDADLGLKSFRADDNVPNIPSTGSNDSGDFSFTFALPSQNFLTPLADDGNPDTVSAPVSPTVPGLSEPIERGGVKIEFPVNTFKFVAGGGSSFTQTVKQTTFTGGIGGNEVQIVEFHADSASDIPDLSTGQGNNQPVNWNQSIEEGGFNLGLTNGTFIYGEKGVGEASAPTGAGQSTGSETSIGGFNG